MLKVVRDIHKCQRCGLQSSTYKADKSIYDDDYYKKYERYSRTILGTKINKFRWDFIKQHITGGLILDYGCGCGHFLDLKPPGSYFTKGYDINPRSPYSDTMTRGHYNAVTFWDSLEHMDDPYGTLCGIESDWFFMTVPDPTDFKKPITEWLHYRPHEHIHHFDRNSLDYMMSRLGYEVVSCSNGEGELRNPKNQTWLLTVAARRK